MFVGGDVGFYWRVTRATAVETTVYLRPLREKKKGGRKGRGGLMTAVKKKKKNQNKGSQNRFLSFSTEIPSHKDTGSN